MSRESERPVRFESLSGIPVEPLYTPESLGADWSYADKLGQPGEYPFTRGVYPTMYRGRLWTMRHVRRLRHAGGHQRALQVPARARARPGSRRPSTCRR